MCNSVKFGTRLHLLPVLKIVTCTAHAEYKVIAANHVTKCSIFSTVQ